MSPMPEGAYPFCPIITVQRRRRRGLIVVVIVLLSSSSLTISPPISASLSPHHCSYRTDFASSPSSSSMVYLHCRKLSSLFCRVHVTRNGSSFNYSTAFTFPCGATSPPWAIPAHRLCELPRAIFLIIFSNVGFRPDKDLLQTFALFPSDIAHHSSSHQNNTFVDTLFFEGFLPSHRHLLQLTFPLPSFFAWRQNRVSTFSFLLFPFPLRSQTRAKTILTPHSREMRFFLCVVCSKFLSPKLFLPSPILSTAPSMAEDWGKRNFFIPFHQEHTPKKGRIASSTH